LGDTVRTGFPAPNGVEAVFPSRGSGNVCGRTDRRHRRCGRTLVDLRYPSTSWSTCEVVGSFGIRHRLLQPWSSRTRLLQFFLAPSRSCTLSNAIAIRPWAFGVLQGHTVRPPPCRLASRLARLGSSHGVSLPSAVVSTKDPVFFQGFPHPRPMRPQGSGPLDALIPLVPSRHFCRGRSWDCYLQGISPPAAPRPLSRPLALLALPDPMRER